MGTSVAEKLAAVLNGNGEAIVATEELVASA
jgi:hypothetical protein